MLNLSWKIGTPWALKAHLNLGKKSQQRRRNEWRNYKATNSASKLIFIYFDSFTYIWEKARQEKNIRFCLNEAKQGRKSFFPSFPQSILILSGQFVVHSLQSQKQKRSQKA